MVVVAAAVVVVVADYTLNELRDASSGLLMETTLQVLKVVVCIHVLNKIRRQPKRSYSSASELAWG
jgi:hypothetical protein